MSAADLLDGLPSIVTSLAAVVGLRVAWLGLSTWKQQIQWEQGRGLARSLLVSANAIRTRAREVRTEFFFQLNQTAPPEAQSEWHNNLQERVVNFVSSFEAAVDQFEQHTVEAKLLWKASFDEPLADLRHIAHVVRSYLYSGLGSVHPRAKEHDRRQSAGVHVDFHSEIYSQDNIYLKLNVAISKIEKIIASELPR